MRKNIDRKYFKGELWLNSLIEENRYSTNINYILSQESIFYEVGYKVLQNQVNNGFVKCVKVMHNGKIKLVYDISKYKDLETVIQNSGVDIFIKIIRKLLIVALNVEENGFIEYKNINTNLNSIFVDTNNLNIYYIYIPVIYDNGRTEKTFSNELKQNILKAIDNNKKLTGSAIDNLYSNLNSSKSLENIFREINISTANIKSEVKKEYGVKKEVRHKLSENHIDSEEHGGTRDYKDTKNKKRYIGSFSSIFSRKRKNKAEEHKSGHNTSSFRTKYEHYNNCHDTRLLEEDGTTLLSEEQSAKIALTGVNTPEKITIVIDKPEFIIGSKDEYVEGLITFNKAISRKHCSILKENEKYYMVDLGSSNGTFINGRRLEKDVKEEIVPGDIVTLANSEFMIVEIRHI